MRILKKTKLAAVIFVVFLFVWFFQQTPSYLKAQETSLEAGVLKGTNGGMSPQGIDDPHLTLTPITQTQPGDLESCDRLIATLKHSLAKFEQTTEAEKAGYWKFPPNSDDLNIVHYVNPWLSHLENWRIDPTLPGSILYQRQPNEKLKLIGAMFNAPVDSTIEELNKRIPTSVARWHLHTNICLPEPIWDEGQWQRKKEGYPVFGPFSPIATQTECEKVGGKFKETVLGWMVHVYAFTENSQDIFNPYYGN